MDFQYGHRHQQQQQQQRPEQQQQEQHQQQINMMTISSGLTRYRSAPSSYFASYLEDSTADTINSHGGGGYGMDDLDHFLNRFLPSSTTTEGQQQRSNLCTANSMQSPHRTTSFVKQELQTDYSQPMMSQTNHNSSSSTSMDCFSNNRILSSSNQFAPIKMATGGGNNSNSNLVRYNSSPAGLFANIDIPNEYGAVSGTGNHGKGISSSSSSSRLMSPISEIHETKAPAVMAETTGFPNNSSNTNNLWEDDSTLMLSDTFLKGLRDDIIDDNNKNQNKAPPTTLLSRHLSLPNTISSNTVDPNLSAMETLMQDSVLCKLRAKRGCATHPRSIAERVRRTRISERMRKLQELVPNMEKQTNTSDMLDLAVDYIKDLQDQVKTLSDNRAKCRCTKE